MSVEFKVAVSFVLVQLGRRWCSLQLFSQSNYTIRNNSETRNNRQIDRHIFMCLRKQQKFQMNCHNRLLKAQIFCYNGEISVALTDYLADSPEIWVLLPDTYNVSGDLCVHFLQWYSFYFTRNTNIGALQSMLLFHKNI